MSTQSCPDQQILFKDLRGDLNDLRKEREKLMGLNKAKNTLVAYGHSWKVFRNWCEAHSKCPMPVEGDTLTLFLTWCRPHYKMATIWLHMAALRHYYEQAGLTFVVDCEIRDLLGSIAREKAQLEERGPLAGKRQITIAQLRKISRSLESDEEMDARDRALILLLFASGWRRNEMSRAALKDVVFEDAGLRMWQAFSKGDQEGKGKETIIPYAKNESICAVRALKVWLKVRGDWRGPLFTGFNGQRHMTRNSLGKQAIGDVLHRALARIGQDSTEYGAHSLRSGIITHMAEQGKSLRAIMDHTGHKSIEMVMRYVKSSGDGYNSSPLSGVL
jgi:site-specific recombinase XerD